MEEDLTSSRTELSSALQQYWDYNELAALKTWVERNPEHPDVVVWREVVAQRAYDALIEDGTHEPEGDELGEFIVSPDRGGLHDLARRYPETIAGRNAMVALEGEELRRLSKPVLNPLVFDFLDGGDQWSRSADGQSLLPAAGADDFRKRHSPRLRERIADQLVGDQCKRTMGYCNWWIARYPDHEATGAIAASMKKIWWKRGHPRWEGKAHLVCAHKCSRRCRKAALPLDDTCYDPCFSRC